ncbi:hypothetical protein C1645_821866 [Glomus cerebriforme]|uniref:Uncharacterized protein n=1 Tax=Glomus cerebriforme TaxID=658196 RepID=A0A397T042_9GLOM|nr:hypothetical protein C1645_821866 [Glomus cerebriforme]
MDENLFCDQLSFNVATHPYNFSTTQYQASSQGNVMNFSNTSTTFDAANQVMTHNMASVLSYLKFFHFSSNDKNFYQIICKNVDSASFDDNYPYNHGFFFQHDPVSIYYVTCRLLPDYLVEYILNNVMDFDGIDLNCKVFLSVHQRLNLEQSLRQKIFDIMHSLHCANLTTQPGLTTDIQTYNNRLPNNVHQDAIGLDHPQQIVDSNNFTYQNYQNDSETSFI